MIVGKANDSVVVVGAGIIGIACAHYLNKAGFSVTVIDQNTVGSGCSYGNCGHILPSHVLPLNSPSALTSGIGSFFKKQSPFKMKLSLNPSYLKWLLEFMFRCRTESMIDLASKLQPLLESSSEEYLSMAGILHNNLEQKGLLYVYESERAFEGYAATDQLLQDRLGVKAKRLSGKELNALDSAYKDSLAGAFHYASDMHVQPERLISSWEANLRGAGVRFIENCRFESCSVSEQRVTALNTTHGMIDADHVVIAAGAWSAQLAKTLDCKIPMQPGKGYSLTLPKGNLSPEHPAFFLEKGVGITTFENNFRIGAMMELKGYSTSIPRDRMEYLKQSVNPYLSEGMPNPAMCERWTGWRPVTWDSLPIIGRAPKLRNVVLATGHHMLGVTMATGTGKLVSEIITETRPHIDMSAYSPCRF